MAVSPMQIARFDKTEIDRYENDIDRELRSKHLNENGVAEIILAGNLLEVEKEALRDRYLAAGWKEVGIVNSSENGERPGLFRVTLQSV